MAYIQPGGAFDVTVTIVHVHVNEVNIVKSLIISSCACILIVKKHALISEGVLIFKSFLP